ncbi:MAG TPA: ThiF family adenylyltransferase, partial [Candidatus Binataceae bacterium]|nr:ThiF family adenylyltransferase [Candidatus Binataceae bacterium]
MLTTRQIERYSRQIITLGFGSTAQERMLAADVVVAGKLDDVDPVLPYLVGAGAGRVRLDSNSNEPTIASLQSRFKDLNPDVEFANQAGDGCDLVLAIASDETTAQRVADLAKRYYAAALIYARLDAISAIAVIPSRPPCLGCADSELMAPLTRPCSTPG